MRPDLVNHLNSGLMLVSLALAFVLPFELFLLSYAILGPLHYLTELSWLHDRNYFLGARRLAIPLVLLTVFTTLSAGLHESITVKSWQPFNAEGVLLAFGLALVFVVFKSGLWQLVGSFGLVGLVFFAHKFNAIVRKPKVDVIQSDQNIVDSLAAGPLTGFDLMFMIFLTTLIHVFVFTGAFVLFGALKAKSRSGYISFAVFLGCAVACFVPSADPSQLTDYVYNAYANTAQAMNYYLPALLDTERMYPDSSTGQSIFMSVYRSEAGVKIARFISFAYTYHYLNWFSKTSVIKWHQVPRMRIVVVIVIWLVSLGIYAKDYVLGLKWLFFLSMLHVFMEFPLNWRSFHGIGTELWSRMRPAT